MSNANFKGVFIDGVNYLDAIRDSDWDPYAKLTAAVVYTAILDAQLEPGNVVKNGQKRDYARNKITAIDFLLSEQFEVLLSLSGLKISTDYVFSKLKRELTRREEMVRLIDSLRKKTGRPPGSKNKNSILRNQELVLN